jgi:23S rRNA (cytidine1920-2'-O)/16S rRNA (cytidine1409-2'-O)-methyltransferase
VKPAAKERADRLLVDRGLVESRERAQAWIMAGVVRCDGRRVEKAGERLAVDAALELAGNPIPYVSRGGLKLEAALEGFDIDATGMTALDVGASTGGFVDCLLQHGAVFVHAIDVGRGQLHWKLRQDPRVRVVEGLNARYLKAGDFNEPFQLATADVSFISLRLILPAIRASARPDRYVLLVKPQFEVGRDQVERGGLVTDPAKHRQVLQNMMALALAEELSPAGLLPSPVRGAKGNLEFLLYLRSGEPAPIQQTMDAWIEEAVR